MGAETLPPGMPAAPGTLAGGAAVPVGPNDATIDPAAPSAPTAVAPQPRMLIVEAGSEDQARAAAAKELGVPARELQLRVLSRQKKGLFGLGGEILEVETKWVPPPPPPPSTPGRVEISCVRGKLSLAVFRPKGPGRAADIQALEALIEGWPLDARDEGVIAVALRAGDEQPRIFATMAPSVKPDDSAPVAVRVASDDATAWLIPWNPEPVTDEAIREALAAAKVESGVDEALVQSVVGQPMTAPKVIARGKPAKDGVDARPDYVFQSLSGDDAQKPAVDASGRVDFREMGGNPLSVQPGDVLVRKVPLVPAEDGFTVRGKSLPAKPAKDLDLKKLAGQNTQVSEDGMEIHATTSGLAGRVGERIVVMPIRTVEGDVDFKTGNVYFEGNLQVRGGVKPGFKVSATGNVQIGAAVEAAQIEAGGDVVVNAGIIGQGECQIKAGGGVTARFIESAEIHAGGPVVVASEIRQSTVISEKSVTVGGAGRIVGGLVRGRDFVEAKVGGTTSSTPTTIQAGWGEQLDVEVADASRTPKVILRNEVHGGLLITVAGASQRFTHGTTGGVWREKEGKLIYSAN